MLPKSVVKKLIKESIAADGLKHVSSEAIAYMIEKAEQFIRNVSKNSIIEVQQSKLKTLNKRHLELTLDKVSLVLKNLPSVEGVK